jgi:hypothetical protein
VTNSHLEAHKVVTIYNGRAEIENRIKEGKNTLRRDKRNLAGPRISSKSSKASRRVVYHAGKWCVHVASAFSLARYYIILFA